MMEICIFRCQIVDHCVNYHFEIVSLARDIATFHKNRFFFLSPTSPSWPSLFARLNCIYPLKAANGDAIIIIANGISFVQTAKLKHSIRKTIPPMSWRAHSNIAFAYHTESALNSVRCVCVCVCCLRGCEQRNSRLCNVIRSASATATVAAAAKNTYPYGNRLLCDVRQACHPTESIAPKFYLFVVSRRRQSPSNVQ